MTAKQSRASARKLISALPSWTDKYGKASRRKLTALGLEKRTYTDVIGEISLLRGMLVKPQFVISSAMSVRNELTTDRLSALIYGIQRMTPVAVLVGTEYGRVGGTNAFRPLPNRSVKENASGSNRQLGTLRRLFTEGPCRRCNRDVGFDTEHHMGGRSSLACCHLVPEQFGGTTDYHNVVVGCAECNYQIGSYVDGHVMLALRQITILVPIHIDRPE